MYKQIKNILYKFFKPSFIYKNLFNLSPLYRRTTGRVKFVSDDLYKINVEIPLNYKNRNYSGSIFGGSLFSATDPIYMMQLIHILGDKYIVWDKAATIEYKKPARERAYVVFEFTVEEIEKIKTRVRKQYETVYTKQFEITDKVGNVFCKVEKVLYIAYNSYYKARK